MITPLHFVCKYGQDITDLFDELAALRIAVFRDFPYLYEGSLAYERAYLGTYARSDRSMLFAVYDADRMVGATTCIPLAEETDDVQEAFVRANMEVSKIFYFGESVLLPPYRGQGLGHRFFDEREAHVQRLGTYDTTCFCAVDRPGDHPMRPPGYKPLDAFWAGRGYQQDAKLRSTFSWPDVGESDATPKSMLFWIKKWSLMCMV
ncbi:MAG: GNAT family N-acetyltransferase [Saprospiraceae bacterium]